MENKKPELPKLEYYIDRVNEIESPDIIGLSLSSDEKAVILKAADWGITDMLSAKEFDLLFEIVRTIKNQIAKDC